MRPCDARQATELRQDQPAPAILLLPLALATGLRDPAPAAHFASHRIAFLNLPSHLSLPLDCLVTLLNRCLQAGERPSPRRTTPSTSGLRLGLSEFPPERHPERPPDHHNRPQQRHDGLGVVRGPGPRAAASRRPRGGAGEAAAQLARVAILAVSAELEHGLAPGVPRAIPAT